MVTEYAQLLSTAHRILDGEMYMKEEQQMVVTLKDGNCQIKEKIYLFKASHVNHPCNVWVRESKSNYRLMYKIYMACLSEYTYRYGKIHGLTRPSICPIETTKQY